MEYSPLLAIDGNEVPDRSRCSAVLGHDCVLKHLAGQVLVELGNAPLEIGGHRDGHGVKLASIGRPIPGSRLKHLGRLVVKLRMAGHAYLCCGERLLEYKKSRS